MRSLLGITEHRGEASDESDGVNKFTEINALTNLVGVLLVTSTNTEHGRMSHHLVIDPLLGGRDLERARGDNEANTIGGEDPARDTRLLGDHESFRLDNMRSDNGLVVSNGSSDARMLLGGDPGVVDLLVLESKALPRGVGVERGTNVDDEALLTELLDRLKAVDVSKASIGGLTEGHTTIEAESELLRDSAVTGSIDLGPGGSASAVAEEFMVKEADALLVAVSSLGDDKGGGLKRVASLPWHGTVARLADDLNLDLHTATLTTVDTKSGNAAVTGTLGVDDGIREELSRDVVSLEDVTADEHGCTTIVILLSDGSVGANNAATEGAKGLELEHDLGGDDLRDDTSKLIGRATAEDEVLPLLTRGEEAELLAHLLLVDLGGIGEAVVAVDALADTLVPGRAEGVDGVGVAVEVEDLLLGSWDSVLAVLDDPDEVAHLVEVDILRALNGADLDDALLEVLQAGELVVAHAALGVLVAVVGGDADGLAKELCGEGAVLLSKLCNTLVKRHFL